MEVIEPQAPLRREPRPDAPLDTEALKGERVTVYDSNAEGWAWGQLAADDYVGWLPANALAPPGAAPTHKVAALRTFAFPGPSIKLPPIEALPLGAKLAVARIEDRMAVTQAGAYVPAAHLKPIGENETDFVAVAERFVGVPYLWGGKTALGLDCSGLVQIALAACGISCPRDSDMQEQALGTVHRGRSRSLRSAARRSRVLERPCRHRARPWQPPSRQRVPHGGRDRADRRRRRPHPRRRQRDHQRAAHRAVDRDREILRRSLRQARMPARPLRQNENACDHESTDDRRGDGAAHFSSKSNSSTCRTEIDGRDSMSVD